MNGISGKVALVTGGATGIGAAVVERLASEGAMVACCYNRSVGKAEILEQKLRSEGKKIYIIKVDVTEGSEVKRAVDSVREHFGRDIGILVNNAGDVFDNAPVEEMAEETWDTIIGINLRGTFLCCKYCLPGMKAAKSGRIVNMSSISARSGGGSGNTHYAASKGGIEAFTRALAKECAASGITVNAVSPGVIYTPMHERISTPEKLEALRQRVPALRLGTPDEVAGAVSFLCSGDAAYITGAILPVNGGMRMD